MKKKKIVWLNKEGHKLHQFVIHTDSTASISIQ
jgi:hypothetical protein